MYFHPAHQKLSTASVPQMYMQTTGIPSSFYGLLIPMPQIKPCHFFKVLSVPFFGRFGEDFHQSEDGFSILILTNKIMVQASQKDNIMPATVKDIYNYIYTDKKSVNILRLNSLKEFSPLEQYQ